MLHIVVDDERHLTAEAVDPDDIREHYCTSKTGLLRIVELFAGWHLDPQDSVLPVTLWLDHDLGGEDTTWCIVRFLQAMAQADPFSPWMLRSIVVHSQNPIAARRMCEALQPLTAFIDLTYEPAGPPRFKVEGGGSSPS